MKNNKSVDFIRILFLLCSVSLLTGFAFYKVDLNHIDDKHPLVNLGSIIHSGGQYLPNNMISSEDSDAEDIVEASVEAKDPITPEETMSIIDTTPTQEDPPKKEDITVTIIGTKFFFDSNAYGRDIDTVEVYVKSWKDQGIHVTFDLDLADYKTVMALWDMLEREDFTDYEPKE